MLGIDLVPLIALILTALDSTLLSKQVVVRMRMVTLTWPLTCDLGDWRFFLQRSAFAVSIVKSSSCRGSLVRIFQV